MWPSRVTEMHDELVARAARRHLVEERTFLIALARKISRVKWAKTAKSGTQVNPGWVSRQPYVRSLQDKHECDENRAGWRMQCRFGITTGTGYVQR